MHLLRAPPLCVPRRQSLHEHLERSVAADEAAAALGLEHNPSLRALAEATEEPWRSILTDHHEAFLAVTREITALADANRELITVGYRSARETLMSMGDGAEGYNAESSPTDLSSARMALRTPESSSTTITMGFLVLTSPVPPAPAISGRRWFREETPGACRWYRHASA